MSRPEEFEKPTRLMMESTLLSVGGVVDAAAPVSAADVRAVETVSRPVADLVRAVSALHVAPGAVETPPVSALDLAEMIAAVQAIPDEEKMAVASLSPDFARIIATVDTLPILPIEIIGEQPTPVPTPFPTPFPTPLPTPLPTPPPIPTPAPIPPPGQPQAPPFNAAVLTQLRAQLDASMPRAQAGATITAEAFNAMRAAILAVIDGVLAAAARPAQPVAPQPIPGPVPLPSPLLPFIGPAELSRARSVLSDDLAGEQLLSTLRDKGLISEDPRRPRPRGAVE